ncbi:ABC transporter permease [Clostridium malenominatum]|uniref:ABC transporter permease n=1 Tax=Clostridium malenominatum TaxID=1539 RepID=A0ABN1IQX5_9CLOT
MITNYNQLTGKYLRANKKRNILTVIGIILSVALISSIGLFIKGMQDLQIEDAKNSRGAYHLIYKKVDESLALKLKSNPSVGRSGLYKIGEKFTINNELVIEEVITTDSAIELSPYKIKEGKIPEINNEVAVEKWVLETIDKNIKIGDKFKITDKEYKLVGILDDVIKNQMDTNGVLLRKDNNIDEKNSMMLIEISSKANLKKALKELNELAPVETIVPNTVLLEMQGAGGFNSALGGLYTTVAVIISIVVVATIAVIYNSFYISVVERIKQFGLLRAIGTTPKQIRNLVFREASVLALIGVPIGLICGVIAICGIDLAFKLIAKDAFQIIKLSLSPRILGISGLIGLLTIYMSAFIPAHFAGKLSPLVAISSRNSITKEKIKRRKSLIMGSLFGFEGSLASKNIKRNRKRYRVTVFSIIISVVLFITFKSFMDLSFNIGNNLNESMKTHFSVIISDDGINKYEAIDDNIINDIKSLSSIDKVYKVYDNYSFLNVIAKNKEIDEFKNFPVYEGSEDIYRNINIDGGDKTLMSSSIAIYDKEAIKVCKKYIKSGNIDVEKLNKEKGVILIGKNIVFNPQTKNNFYGPIADIKVEDEIPLQYINPSKDPVEFGKGEVKKVKVMAILKDEPFFFRGSQNGLKIIATEEIAKELVGAKEIQPVNLNIMIKDEKNSEKVKEEIEGVIKSNSSLRIINHIDNNREGNSAILMVKILLYGFVIVVSLIGSVNIINTLTTNIILRKKEFGMLKAVGLTQKGLKKMITLEGLLYGVVGTVYGSVIGTGLSYLTFSGMNRLRESAWVIPWDSIAIAGAAAIIIGYVSVLAPLRRIEKENLIDGIREEY